MALIPIVNDKDKIIGYKERKEIKREEIYRVSALWITNSKGDILLAQRAFTKSHDPGRWGPAVAGTVEKGETYKSNIIKEAFEEIGLKDIKPVKGPKRRINAEHNHFSQWYYLKTDIKTFKTDPIEVAGIRWISKDALIKDLKKNPSIYLKGMPGILEELYK